MIGALWTGISGLASQQKALDNESNNIANVNTIGYKASRMSFADQMYQNSIGKGSKVLDAEKIYEQGSVNLTGVSYDMALKGDGFFTVSKKSTTGTSEIFYTRAGNFRMGDNGTLQDAAGNEVQGWSMVAMDKDKDVTTSNPNVKTFTSDYGEMIDSQIVRYSNKVETYTAKATDYSKTAKADSSTVFSGAGLKTQSSKIADVEAAISDYNTWLQRLKENPDGVSESSSEQASYVKFKDKDEAIISKEGDQLFVYVDGVKYSQEYIPTKAKEEFKNIVDGENATLKGSQLKTMGFTGKMPDTQVTENLTDPANPKYTINTYDGDTAVENDVTNQIKDAYLNTAKQAYITGGGVEADWDASPEKANAEALWTSDAVAQATAKTDYVNLAKDAYMEAAKQAYITGGGVEADWDTSSEKTTAETNWTTSSEKTAAETAWTSIENAQSASKTTTIDNFKTSIPVDLKDKYRTDNSTAYDNLSSRMSTYKAMADRLSSITGLKAEMAIDVGGDTSDDGNGILEDGESVKSTTKVADMLKGMIKITSLIPGKEFLISEVAESSGSSTVQGTSYTLNSAKAGSGVGALESSKNALAKLLTGKQRDVYSPTDLLGNNKNYNTFKLGINVFDKEAGENVFVPRTNSIPPEADQVEIDLSTITDYDTMTDTEKIDAFIKKFEEKAANSNPDLSGYIEMKNVNGNLVVETKDSNYEVDFSSNFQGKNKVADADMDTLERSSTFSGREGAGAEFMEIVTKIDQTASQNSLQLRLDTLGISDSAFGEFKVDNTGLITMTQDGAEFAVGQVSIAVFNNNRGLTPLGDNLLKSTTESGKANYTINNDKTAKIEGKSLELSTADLSKSLVNLMVFQRAFEANAKSITTADSILSTLIDLKR